MTQEQALQLFSDRMQPKMAAKGNYGFDRSIIIAIITAIMEALGGCPKPPVGQLKSPGFFLRVRMNRAMTRQCATMKWLERQECCADAFAVAKESTDEEADAFLCACCDVPQTG